MDREKQVREAETRLRASEKKVKWAESLEAARSKNPMEVLDHLGMSSDDLMKRVSEGQTTNPVYRLEKQVSELAQRLEEAQRREEEARTRSMYEEAGKNVTRYVTEAKTSEGNSKFPLVQAAGVENLVFEKIRERYQADGTVISEDEAASEVEKQVAELFEKLAKARGHVTPPPQATKTPVTLSNLLQSQPAPTPSFGDYSKDSLEKMAVQLLRFEEKD
jgi:hypothetical protein